MTSESDSDTQVSNQILINKRPANLVGRFHFVQNLSADKAAAQGGDRNAAYLVFSRTPYCSWRDFICTEPNNVVKYCWKMYCRKWYNRDVMLEIVNNNKNYMTQEQMSYGTLATTEVVESTMAALRAKGIDASVVANSSDVLKKIKELIPKGASVMNGASVTLEQVGFIEYLKGGDHGWNNLHEAIVMEKDPVKQGDLRKQALHSDYYLGSTHALAQTGELLIASNSGSQLPHIVFTSPNLVFVVSTKKIVPTLEDTYKRLSAHVIPLEDERALKAYGVHTAANKIVVFQGENSMMGRKVHVILVSEDLGY